jgi:hypothetical protein
MYFWKNIKITNEGTTERVPMAKMAPQSVEVWGSANILIARETVKSLGRFR